jgi:hypothetical protein
MNTNRYPTMFSHLVKETGANRENLIMTVGIQPGFDMGVSRIVLSNFFVRFKPFHKIEMLNKAFCIAGVESCEITQKT